MYIGGGIPPFPEKWVHRIQKGNFIDMAELLSANLEIVNATDEDHSKLNGHKLQQVTNITDWFQCFSTYIAVVSRTEPEHVADLLTYLNLIIRGQRSFQDLEWASCDRQFRWKASSTSTAQWGVMEGTLWYLPHSGAEIRSTSPSLKPHPPPSIKKAPICLEWNEYPSAGCPHPICCY